jgi:hypothetical protein
VTCQCSELRKQLRETRLPEGAIVRYGGVEAVVGPDGRLRPETLRKANGKSGFANAVQELAEAHARGGRIRVGASGPRRLG